MLIEPGNEAMPYPVTEELRVRVGGIFPPGNIFFSKVVKYVTTAQHDKGPQDTTAAGGHCGKAGWPRPPEYPHQRRFQHIVSGVGDQNFHLLTSPGLKSPGFTSRGLTKPCPPAVQTRCRLNAYAPLFCDSGDFPWLNRDYTARYIEPFAQGADTFGIAPAFRLGTYPMLNMDATEFIIERTPIPQGGKGDKHGSGISPTGNRGKEHGPRRTTVQNSGNGIFKVGGYSPQYFSQRHKATKGIQVCQGALCKFRAPPPIFLLLCVFVPPCD
jgi:hypothetical protein